MVAGAVMLLHAAALFVPTTASAQEPVHVHGAAPAAFTWSLGAQAVPLVTHATPAIFGEDRTEAYLTQPNVMAHMSALNGRLALLGTLNLEGLTLQRGELNAGIWGEGYIDRRHPHTYLHEVMAVAQTAAAAEAFTHLSLAVGKGFAPFGTDDPMMRPFVKFPANHHLAQVLERLVAVAAVRAGPGMLEIGVFNGDEPESPTDLPDADRFGDSWSVRGTLLPVPGAELSASYAFIASPEQAAGSGIDHRKRSAAARFASAGGRVYGLVEWAKTDEFIGSEPTYSFESVLAEGAVRYRLADFALRYERTLRPEEERLKNPFRSPRPHPDVHLLGATRWNIVSAAVSAAPLTAGALRARPFVEVSYAHARETLGSLIFDPAKFYGSDRMWSLSAGVRLDAGMVHRRMGRYGAATYGAHVH